MPERLRILTWHVHGNYLYYLSQIPHDLYLVTKPGHPPGYAGAVGALPWGANVHEVPYDEVPNTEFDCVLYQHQRHWDSDRLELLTETQRRLPTIFLEHDPPQQHPTATVHPVQDPNVLLVHVTPFNALMWDSGVTPSRVIEHGVLVDPNVRYSGELERGICVVNNLQRRGRRLGADVFAQMRDQLPLDLVGMAAEEAGGLGEVPNPELAAFCARYRFFFNPIRYTSLGLAVVEAMAIGMPIVGLATTEMSSVIRNECNGYVDTRPERLVDVMRQLLADPGLAMRWGQRARATAMERFGIERFVDDWCRTLRTFAA
ncbi:glycosyltransferase family 4 protein [Cupriavidus sp. AU9028]|uniref:glycosyltransferase family 4 protein n=1 Tax=Cupriavidus sp. AU9028 TaxID=2871157 RepID=UPI001C9471A6|nr:glycosyltransferase family 4 protein [Cupriavidus sp. AU9028]MBY4896081.1 glycosyltransferase family 4 protein [Cupriavidus sp. AU9028]